MADLTEELFGSPVKSSNDLTEELFGTKPKFAPVSRTDKIIKGVTDPIEGGAQLLTNMLPQSVVNAGNAANNWLADKTGLVARIPEGGMNQLVADNEKAYQAQRAAGGESGFDGYRTIGNVLSPANVALASKLPLGATLASRIGFGAGGGAATALSNPVTDGDFWGEKGKQVGMGAMFGGAVPMVSGAISRVISPNASTNPSLALLKSEGVNPTVGQSLGGRFNALEQTLQSTPIMGDAIRLARERSGQDLNRAAFTRALSPVGESLPMGVKIGNDAVEYTRKTLGNKYDQLLPKLTTQADEQFAASLNNLKSMVSEGALDPKYAKKFEQIMRDRVEGKFQGQSAITGQTLKDIQSYLTDQIKRFGASQDPDARLMADALKEVGSQLNSLVVRTNPKYAEELKAINTGYANFKRIQKAASYLGAEDGVFSPANLQGAVRAADRSKDKARFAEGNALMQDLSGAGASMLANKVPDSGTAQRLAYGAGALASGVINPAIPAGLLAGAAAYTPQMQRLLSGMVSSRPELSQPVSNALRQASPFLVPGGAQVGLGLLDY